MTDDPVPVQFVPRLVVDDGDAAMDFYQSVFAMSESNMLRYDDGRIANVDLSIGDAQISITSSIDEMNQSPVALAGSPVIISVNHPNPDQIAQDFLKAGGEILIPVDDRAYGRRDGRLKDPFGHLWIPSRPLTAE